MRSLLGLIAAVSLAVPVLPDAGAAQGRAGAITGRVTAEDTGQPLAGVSVSVVGTPLGAVSAQDGRYAITGVAPGTYQLLTSLIGYAQHSVARVAVQAGTGVTVDVRLRPQAISLAEVVVVGYGSSQRREEITSAVSSVTSEQFIAGPARDAASLVAGKLPGLSILTTNGDPRGGTEISLRGRATMNGSTTPLVLVDGVPGGLETVASEDIESITVLKDGSAGAVYG
ncbi:MAG: carboxypeptidase-like regulatory domain-containing protein, partial [Gemmatimonadales bacterium]